MNTPRYRAPLLETLRKGHLFTIDELQRHLRKADHSTLFRNLETLVSEGLVRRVILSRNTVAYEEAGRAHGHLVCTKCARVRTVPLSSVSPKGFALDDFLGRGICRTCIP